MTSRLKKKNVRFRQKWKRSNLKGDVAGGGTGISGPNFLIMVRIKKKKNQNGYGTSSQSEKKNKFN